MKLKTLAISAVVAGMLIGCSSADDTTTTNDTQQVSNTQETTNDTQETTNSSSGVVADGYIKGAKVFIDENSNDILDNGEILATTDENGKFSLEYNDSVSGNLVVIGGEDIERGVNFEYIFKVPLNSNINLTPFTTMAYFYAQEKDISFDNAVDELASSLGISSSDFTADPEKTDSIKTLTTQIQSMIEATSKYLNYDNSKYKDLYKDFAKNLVTSNDDNIEDKIKNAFNNLNIDDKAKKVALSMFDQVGDMAKNGDFSKYEEVVSSTIDVINTNPDIDLDTLKESVDTQITSQTNQDILNSRAKIDELNSNLDNLSNPTKVASVEDAKVTMNQIRDIIYEVIDPNIENQETNASTLIGNISNNVENYIKPATTQIDDDLEALNTRIDTALRDFDSQLDIDFNDSITALDDRITALDEILDKYDDNVSFDEEETSFGDTISHTYNVEDGIVTTAYTLNGETLTITYPQKADLSESEIKVSGEVSLQEDNKYNLKVTNLSLKDNKLVLNTLGEIYGENGSKIDASIDISIEANNDDFLKGNIAQSLNIDLKIDGNIQTSNNQTFNGLITLNDTNLLLDGKFEDSNIKLEANVSVSPTNTEWKRYIDEHNQADAYDGWGIAVFYVDDKLATKIDYNYATNDMNLTSYDGELYECSIIEGNISCDNAQVKGYKAQELYNKVMNITINNKPIVITDLEYDWEDSNGDIETWTLDLESGFYELTYENDKPILHIGEAKEDVTSVSDLTLSEPMDAKDLVGGIKVSGYVKDKILNIEANLNLGIVSNGASKEAILNDVTLTTNNLDVTINSIKATYNEDTNITTALLNGIDGSLTDTNNNKVTLSNVYTSYSENLIPDTKALEFFGKVSYLDTTFDGYFKANYNYKTDESEDSFYATISRTNYEPMTITGIHTWTKYNDYGVDKADILFEKGDYKLGVKVEDYDPFDEDIDSNETVNLFDSNGVIGEIKLEDSEFKSVILKNKDNEKLADLNQTDNNWEIKYSDDSTSTLY